MLKAVRISRGVRFPALNPTRRFSRSSRLFSTPTVPQKTQNAEPQRTPFDFHRLAKGYAAMTDIMMFGMQENSRPKSPFLTPAQIAPENSPIVQEFKAMSEFATKWMTGSTWRISKIEIDGEVVLESIYRDWIRNFHKIKNFMKPAPFGRGNKTVYDENVRKAFEIEGNRISIEGDRSLVERIQEMAPNGKKLVVKLYKMHIYEEGGKFERHIDTLHAPNHYATLVVGVPGPSQYEGGEFMLEVDGQEHQIDLRANQDGKGSISFNFVVFLTDLPHEIKPVTKGERIVLQYDVFIEDKEEDDLDPDEIVYEAGDGLSYYEQGRYDDILAPPNGGFKPDPKGNLLTLLQEYKAQNPETQVCFLLTQLYPLCLQMQNLRAGDRDLFDLLSTHYELELGYAVNPVIDNRWSGDEKENYNRLSVMTFEDTRALNDFMRHPDQDKDEWYEAYHMKKKNQGPCVVFIGSSARFKRVFESPSIEFLGNHAQEGETAYASAVLSIGPPKSEKTLNH